MNSQRHKDLCLDLSLKGVPFLSSHLPLENGTVMKIRRLDLSSNGIQDPLNAGLLELQHPEESIYGSEDSSAPSDPLSSLPRFCLLTHLSLSNNKLTCVPLSLSHLPHLTWLDLSHNLITCLPPSPPCSTAPLSSLLLHYNRLSSLPPWLVTDHFPNLHTLSLAGNILGLALSRLPRSFGTRRKKLRWLNLNYCKLTTFPEEILGLLDLRHLKVANKLDSQAWEYTKKSQNFTMPNRVNGFNKPPAILFAAGTTSKLQFETQYRHSFISIPPGISRLRSLVVFEASNLGLAVVPESLSTLESLEVLDLSGNHLSRLPSSLSSLRALTVLSVSHNKLVEVPALKQMPRLTHLLLAHNLLSHLPTLPSCLQVLDLYHNYFDIPPSPLPPVLKKVDFFMNFFKPSREEGLADWGGSTGSHGFSINEEHLKCRSKEPRVDSDHEGGENGPEDDLHEYDYFEGDEQEQATSAVDEPEESETETDWDQHNSSLQQDGESRGVEDGGVTHNLLRMDQDSWTLRADFRFCPSDLHAGSFTKFKEGRKPAENLDQFEDAES